MGYIAFRKKMATDSDFARKFADCKTPADVIRMAGAEGYTFTEDDIRNNTDLLPEEIANAAGGGDFTVTPKPFSSPFITDRDVICSK